MFDRNGRTLLAVCLILALVIPAVGVFAAGSARVSAAPAASTPLTWTQVHQLPEGQHYYGIYFPTKDVGYAVSGPDWNVNNGSGAPTYISKTTDGGKTWTSKPIPNTDGWMRGITCTDANNCWITGKVKGSRILRTADGGATWTTIKNSSGYPNWLWSAGQTGQGTTILAGTTCYDPKDGGAVANWLRSTDGQNFEGIIARPGVLTCWVQWDIECPIPGLCYSAGKDYVWRTNNNGKNWTGYFIEPTRQYGLSCTSASSCWIVGKNPWVRSTTNSGANWTANAVVGMPSTGHFWDVAMLDNTTGYAVGCDKMTTDNTDRCIGKGAVYKTEDGMMWLPIPAPGTADLMDIWAFSVDNIIVVDWSGKIWHGTGEPEPTPTPTATATPDTGTVAGIAFDDANGDALRDDDERGLPAATLLVRHGQTEIATVVSGEDGAFRFEGLAPGQYTLVETVAPAGFARSPFLATFRIGVNQELTVYLAHEATGAETPTPTPTATRQPGAAGTPGYLPIITH